MKHVRLSLKALLIAISFAVVFAMSSCGGITSQDVQQGIDVAEDIISVLTTVLRPAVESSEKLCDQLTKDGSPVKEKAVVECAEINDAWSNVEHMSAELQAAITSGVKARPGTDARGDADSAVDAAMTRLIRATDELRAVLAKSATVAGGAR